MCSIYITHVRICVMGATSMNTHIVQHHHHLVVYLCLGKYTRAFRKQVDTLQKENPVRGAALVLE